MEAHHYLPTYYTTYLHTTLPTYILHNLPTYYTTYLHTTLPTYILHYIPTYYTTYLHTTLHTYIHSENDFTRKMIDSDTFTKIA